MKNRFFATVLFTCFLLPLTAFGETGQSLAPRPEYARVADFGRLPLYFIPNRGQRDSRVLYYASASRYTLWLTERSLVFDAPRGVAPGEKSGRDIARLEFLGANAGAKIVTSDPSDYTVSYFESDDPEGRRAGLPTSRAITYQGLYDGIDLKVYGVEREVEYDWIIKPGADPGRIRMAYRDVEKTRIAGEGNLVIETALGVMTHRKPSAYQVIDGRRVAVEAAFIAIQKNEYGFKLGAYDPARELVIDPYVIVSSTYLGGGHKDMGISIAIDTSGAVYIAGYTESGDFPPSSTSFRKDAFVTKLSLDGQSLVYSVFLSASRSANACLAVDEAGAAYLVGQTNSSRFPVKNAFQPMYGGGDYEGFIAKITPNGKNLVYASFLGGSSKDECGYIAVDKKGAAYITGYTQSSDFPVKKAFQAHEAGPCDAFVSKVAPDGKSLVFSTYLGGSHSDYGYSIAIDAAGAIYVAGETSSPNFPIKNAYQKTPKGHMDLFLSKLAADGQSLVYSTYWGSPNYDTYGRVVVDNLGNAYLYGMSTGNIAMKKGFQKVRKDAADLILAKFAPDGLDIVFSTYLGGTGQETGRGVTVDAEGAVYLTGSTASSDFPLKNACQSVKKGLYDAFVSKIAPDGKSLVFSTFLGGNYWDFSYAVLVGSGGDIYVTGQTNSLDFPVVEPYQDEYRGGDYDAFVVKYSEGSQTGARKRR